VPYNYSDPYSDAAIVVSADGKRFIVMTPPTPVVTRDRGRTWRAIRGLPAEGRPVADRVDPEQFYAVDFASGQVYLSRDGGAHFRMQRTKGLPADLAADKPHQREDLWPLTATPDRRGDLWLVSHQGLFHSTDGGRSFTRNHSGLAVKALGFGKAPAGRHYPVLFAIGARDGVAAIWRSDDAGKSWMRINDDKHQYAGAFRCITGDPRIFGRVYVGTDGRGIVYGDVVNR
jgi:hypothetical protein